MAKLYSRMGATAHSAPGYGQFEPGADGAFAFPDDLSDQLLRQHVRKKRMWEDEEMRAERMHQEAEQRHRDPAVLYAAVSELVQLSRNAQGAGASPDLAAELAALREELAELRASVPVPAAADGDSTEAKPAPRRKAAADAPAEAKPA